MVKVGNQGLDDRYIRLRSHRISHPAVSRLRQSHSITFSRPGFRPSNRIGQCIRTYVLIFQSSSSTILQQNFRLIEFRPELVSRQRPRTCNAPCLCEVQFVAFASTSLGRFLGLLNKNKKIKREDYKSHSFYFKREHFMRGFRVCRQFDKIAIKDRFTLVS